MMQNMRHKQRKQVTVGTRCGGNGCLGTTHVPPVLYRLCPAIGCHLRDLQIPDGVHEGEEEGHGETEGEGEGEGFGDEGLDNPVEEDADPEVLSKHH